MGTVPLAEWLPDAGILAGGSVEARNVVPVSGSAYGPLKQPIVVTSALGNTSRGFTTIEGIRGVIHVICGVFDKLYLITPLTSWQILPIGTGYDTGPNTWYFAKFENFILATDGVDPVQIFNMTSPTPFVELSPDAPIARFICVAKNFVVLGSTTDPTSPLEVPIRIWWSALNDATSWPTPGSAAAQAAQSDYNDFSGSDGIMTGLVSNLGNADFAVFFQHSIYRGVYTGPPDVFDFTLAVGAKGCFVPTSIVTLGALVYYLGEDGFYTFDGAFCQPIGFGKVDKWFWANVNPNFINTNGAIVGGYDEVSRTVRWIFPSRATGLSQTADTQLMFQPETGRWTHGSIQAEWISSITASLTSPRPQLAVFLPSHELALFTGGNAAATMTTLEGEMTPGATTYVQGVRPAIDAGAPTVAIGTRTSLQVAQTVSTPTGADITGECPQRAAGRYVQGILTIAAGEPWTRAEALDVRAIPAGTR